MEMNRYETISEVRVANKATGGFWFDPDTMRFFKSRIYGVMGGNRLACNRYFLSSEQNPEGVRRFTVRMVNIFDNIETVGEFHAYRTQVQALKALWDHANKACDCGHLPTLTEGCGTGYAFMGAKNDWTMCYSCADTVTLHDLDNAKRGAVFTLYVSSDGTSITSWSGSNLMRIRHWGKVHPFSRNSPYGERNFLSAVDHNGHAWYGTGAVGMYATLRKAK